jgi:hypothetical protein
MARAYSSQNPGFPYWMLTLSFGKAQLRSALEWSESALAMLSSMDVPASAQPADDIPAAKNA